ncbi:MAG TPA: helix-turn-helix domain-containing protein [Bacteroidales bacterium]|nr:helix-turn-helix domain-containing protein [Bacteroidales bacterium]
MNFTQSEIVDLIKFCRRYQDIIPEDITTCIINNPDIKTGLKRLSNGFDRTPINSHLIRRPTTEKIIRLISRYHGLPVLKVKSQSRKEKLVRTRQQFCLIAILFKYSQEAIGMEIGGRNHSTSFHNKSQALQYCATERDYLDEVNELINLFPRYKTVLLERLELLMEKS